MKILAVNKASLEIVVNEVSNLLSDHKCDEVVAFDVSEKSGWTDYFLIATVSSSGHLRGVLRHLYDFCDTNNLVPSFRQKKIQHDDWIFIDCGSIVFHIMKKESREFYKLDELWHDCTVVYSS